MKGQLGVDVGGPPGEVERPDATSRVSGWRAVVRVLRSPVDDVVTTVFPADCRCCDGPLERAAIVPVCETCVGRVTQSTMPEYGACCGLCGEAIDLDLDIEDLRFAGMLAEGLLCRECRLAAPEFARAVAYGSYHDEMRRMIHLLKFERVPGVAKLLGRQMAEAVLRLEGSASRELLVIAVPLFRQWERQRGYNQSRLLADEALRWLKKMRPEWRLVAAHDALERRKSTESSFVLSPKGRRRNLSGAFMACDNVRGREVLLIDDILTSGATARECARVLMRAGAAKVWVATLARAQKQFVKRQHVDAGEFVARWDMLA